jgi:hypothetical protein
VKEDMSGGGYEGRELSFYGGFYFGGFSWIWREESLSSVVGRISTGGTGLLGVLGMGARISIWYPGARKLS